MAINIEQLNAQLADSRARLEAARHRNDQRMKDAVLAKRLKQGSIGPPRRVSRVTSRVRLGSDCDTKDVRQRQVTSTAFRQRQVSPPTATIDRQTARKTSMPQKEPRPSKYRRVTPELETPDRPKLRQPSSRQNSILTPDLNSCLSFSEALATSSPNVSGEEDEGQEEDSIDLAVRSAKMALRRYLDGKISFTPTVLLQLIDCVCKE